MDSRFWVTTEFQLGSFVWSTFLHYWSFYATPTATENKPWKNKIMDNHLPLEARRPFYSVPLLDALNKFDCFFHIVYWCIVFSYYLCYDKHCQNWSLYLVFSNHTGYERHCQNVAHQVQKLLDCISILFGFHRLPIEDKEMLENLQIWTERMVSLFISKFYTQSNLC